MDASVWRMLRHGDTNSLHREPLRGRGEVGCCSLRHISVAWLQRGVKAKNDHCNHYIKLTGGCSQVNAELCPVSVGLRSDVNSLSVILQDK